MISRDQIMKHNDRCLFPRLFLSLSARAFLHSPLFIPLYPRPFSHPLHLRVECPADCVGTSVCPADEIRQKGCRSRGHLSQSDGAAEKYVTRENQFQRRLAPTGLAVKAIVSVLRREREKERERERKTDVLSSMPRKRRTSRGLRAIYAILSSVRISCGCGLGVKRCFMRRFAAFRQCDRRDANEIIARRDERTHRFPNDDVHLFGGR